MGRHPGITKEGRNNYDDITDYWWAGSFGVPRYSLCFFSSVSNKALIDLTSLD